VPVAVAVSGDRMMKRRSIPAVVVFEVLAVVGRAQSDQRLDAGQGESGVWLRCARKTAVAVVIDAGVHAE